MTDNNIKIVSVDGTDYTLRTRLGWYEQDKIDDKAFRMFAEGRALSEADDLAEIERIEIVSNTAEHNLARLQARLVGVNRGKVKGLPPSHVPVLIREIEELERIENEKREALLEGNPTERPSGE